MLLFIVLLVIMIMLTKMIISKGNSLKKLSSKKVILSLVICLLSLVYFSKPVEASSEINKIDFEIYIDESGTAQVTQKWEGNFNEGTEVYQAYKNMNESTIDNFSVSDESGTSYTYIDSWNVDASFFEKANKCGIVKKNNGYELCFGISKYGSHIYTMKYQIHNFVTKFHDDINGLNWRIISENLTPKPKSFSVKITTTQPFTDENTDIYGFGYEGRCVFENGAIIMNNTKMDTNELGDINYGNIFAKIDSPTYSSYKGSSSTYEEALESAKKGSSYDYDDLRSNYLHEILENYDKNLEEYESNFQKEPKSNHLIDIVSIPFIVYFLALFFKSIVSKGTKTPRLKKLQFSDSKSLVKESEVDYNREIPCAGDLFLYYYIVVKGKVVDEDSAKAGLLSALLLKWVRQGDIDFATKDKNKATKNNKYEISFKEKIQTHYSFESTMIGYFKQASGSNAVLENKEFSKWCREHYELLDSWFEEIMTYEEKAFRKKVSSKKSKQNDEKSSLNSSTLPVEYKVEFKEEVGQIVGFKKFIKEFTLLDEKRVIEVKLWEDYLIFAAVIGLADKVEKEIGELYPDFDKYSNIDYNYTIDAVNMFCYVGIRAAFNSALKDQSSFFNDDIGGGSASGFGGGGSSSFHGGGGSSSFHGGGGSFSGGGGGGIR